MQKIQMVDLVSQHEKISAEIQEAINQVIQEASFINGPAVKEFAGELGEWLGGAHVVPCANGTDALQVALMALELEPGDEVILPVFTFIATAEVVSLLGLVPVFVDVDPDTFNMPVEAVENAITCRTRAIIPVHLFGQCVEMHRLVPLAKKYNLRIVEDTAQALGSRCTNHTGKMQFAGTHGDIACTSFFPSKNLGCLGDGGAIFTTKPHLSEISKVIVNHGSHKKYFHERVGVNSRLDTLQAAVLRIKLKHLKAYNQLRQEAANYYDQALASISGIKIPFRSPYSEHIFHQYTLRVENERTRDSLREHLNVARIPNMIYYPVPLHLQQAYAHRGYEEGTFPVAESLAKCVLSLPIHTELSQAQLAYITQHIKSFF